MTYSVEALRLSVNEQLITSAYLLDMIVLALISFILLAVASKVLQKRLE